MASVRECEVCASLSTEGENAAQKLRRIRVEGRLVVLCEAHAAQLTPGATRSLEALRETFTEPEGRRSLVGRRATADRRMFPARPEGRRLAERRADALGE